MEIVEHIDTILEWISKILVIAVTIRNFHKEK